MIKVKKRKLEGLRMHKSAKKVNLATRILAQARYSRLSENAPVTFLEITAFLA